MVPKSIAKKKTKEIRKRELLNSLQENDDVEEQALNKTANTVSISQEAILIINRYEDIIKTQNKKAIEFIGKQGQLLKNFKDTFLIMFLKADHQYILKFHFLSSSTNIFCLKNLPYNQVISEIILRLSYR